MRDLTRKMLSLISVVILSGIPLAAQTVVSTGRIVDVDPLTGGLSIRTDQGFVLTYEGIVPEQVQFTTGAPGTFSDLRVNRPVTVQYVSGGKEWLVARVLLDPLPPGGGWFAPESDLRISEQQALRSWAVRDGDVTTEPGVRARIDGDITTQPGRAEERAEWDITRRPARVDANYDGDITTHR